MNTEMYTIGFAAWFVRKIDENLKCEPACYANRFHATIKKQLFTREISIFEVVSFA
jgi:hypothetical protein